MPVETKAEWDRNLFRRVDDLDLSVRASNCLREMGIVYVGDLVTTGINKLLRTQNFGKKSLADVQAALTKMDLYLEMHLDNWPPENITELGKQFDCEYFI